MNLTQISGSTAYIGSVVVLLVFAIPAFIGAIKQSGLVRGISVIIMLGAIVIAFETLAAKTGIPYGKFSYGSALNYRLFGSTPWIVALTYPPILLGAFWLARKVSVGFLTTLLTASFATLTYVVLAPAMSKLTLWQWETPGPFFGVPFRSFAGWFVCALISSIILKAIWGQAEAQRLVAYSWFAIILFWAGVNLGIGQLVPGLVGVAAACILFGLFLIEKRRAKEE